MTARARAKRKVRAKRDLHALDQDGMVACNPRDREAAHRAEMEGIATADRSAVTCSKCRAWIRGAGSRPAAESGTREAMTEQLERGMADVREGRSRDAKPALKRLAKELGLKLRR